MGLRLQLERQDKGMFPSISEYFRYYGIEQSIIDLAEKDVIVMHPGPVNRGAEIDTDSTDGTHSVINEQVTNGVAVRMSVLAYLTGKLDGFLKPERRKILPL
jgi:aspartate carbamoyltransferase catalytic subunit